MALRLYARICVIKIKPLIYGGFKNINNFKNLAKQ